MTTTQNTSHLLPAQQALLDESLSLVQDNLRRFIDDPNFEAKIGLAFGQLDMTGLDKMRSLIQDLSEAKGVPTIEILTVAEIEGAQGAFAAATNTVYLSETLLKSRNITSLAEVLLEELGHYLDSQVNTVDALGDEGRLFAELIEQEELDRNRVEILKAEDDTNEIEVNGKPIEVEQADGVTISGKIQFTDKDGNLQDLRNAKVEIYDEDTFGDDDLLATVYTNVNGEYIAQNIEKDSDIYIRVLSEGKTFSVNRKKIGVTPQGSAYAPYSKRSQNVEEDVIEDKIINLTIRPSDDSQVHNSFIVHQIIEMGEHFYKTSLAHKSELISMPGGGLDSFALKDRDPHSKFDVTIIDSESDESNFHQGLLSIAKKDLWNIQKIHFHYSEYLTHLFADTDVDDKASAKDKETRFAWAEGLAIFTATEIMRSQLDYERTRDWSQTSQHKYLDYDIEYGNLNAIDNRNSFGERVAVDIASTLKDLKDQTPFEGYHTGLKDKVRIDVFEILKGTRPHQIKRFDDFYEYVIEDKSNKEKAEIGAILEEYGVSPKIFPKVKNQKLDASPPVFKWSEPGNFSLTDVEKNKFLHNNKFYVYLFNSDFSKLIDRSEELSGFDGSWSPSQFDWDKINGKKGVYNYVISGIEDSDSLHSGGYWSGARSFKVGNVKDVKSASLESFMDDVSRGRELLNDVQDFTQHLPNGSETGLAFLGDIFSPNSSASTAGVASFASTSPKSLHATESPTQNEGPLSVIANIFTTISEKLHEIFPDTEEDITSFHLRDAFHKILGNDGLSILQDADSSGTVDNEDIEIISEGNRLSFLLPMGGTTQFDFDLPQNLNLSQLGLELTTENTTASVDLDYTLNLGLGIDLETLTGSENS